VGAHTQLGKKWAMTREELLKLIEQAGNEGRETLDLRGKGLTELPPEIGF